MPNHPMLETTEESLEMHKPASTRRDDTPVILELLELISQNRKRVLQFLVFGFVLSLAIAFLIPSRYSATARLMPPDQSASMGSAALAAINAKVGDTVGSAAGDLLGMRTGSATLIGILNSRTVQDDLINKYDLRKVYRDKKYEDARKTLAERSDIGDDRKSGIITITVADTDPERAVQLTRSYVDELNTRVSQLTTSSAHRERVFLEERLAKIKQELDESSLALGQFSSKNKTFNPEVQSRAMLEAASTLQGQLIAAETELSGLQQIYGPGNSRVRAASARVGELRSKMQQLAGAHTDGDLDVKAGQPYPSLEQLPLLGNTYGDLYRRAKINETIYEVLTRQYEMAKVQEAKEIPTIKFLDEPVTPERKSWPPRMAIVILGTLAFLVLGISYLLVSESWSRLKPESLQKVAAGKLRRILTGDAPSRPYNLPS